MLVIYVALTYQVLIDYGHPKASLAMHEQAKQEQRQVALDERNLHSPLPLLRPTVRHGHLEYISAVDLASGQQSAYLLTAPSGSFKMEIAC